MVGGENSFLQVVLQSLYACMHHPINIQSIDICKKLILKETPLTCQMSPSPYLILKNKKKKTLYTIE